MELYTVVPVSGLSIRRTIMPFLFWFPFIIMSAMFGPDPDYKKPSVNE
jgi:hypothetical protein